MLFFNQDIKEEVSNGTPTVLTLSTTLVDLRRQYDNLSCEVVGVVTRTRTVGTKVGNIGKVPVVHP